MAIQSFTKNHRDHSNDSGFQFEFFCDKCGSGFRSAFATNKLSVAAQLVKAAGSLFGGGMSRAGWGADQIKDVFRGPAWDAAFAGAIDACKPKFRQCSSCGLWVCPEICWNHTRNVCENCAPDLREHAAKAQAQVAVAQILEQAKGADQTGGMDVRARTATAAGQCPKCQAAVPAEAKFCGSCGTAVASAGKRHCTGCGIALNAGARFCSACGTANQ
jgi:hypothetical protein